MIYEYISYLIKFNNYGYYNPQNEMFANFQTKRSIRQNEMFSKLP